MTLSIKANAVAGFDTASVLRLFNAALADLTAMRDAITATRADAILSSPGLAIGTDKTKVSHASFVDQFNNGVQQVISAGDTAFTATTMDIPLSGIIHREAIFVLSVNSAGTITITKGANANPGLAVAPATPAGQVKLGEVKIQHNGVTMFDATTDELDAAHLTVTYTSATPYNPTPPALTLLA